MRTTIPPVVLREESEDVGRNPTDNPTIGDVIAARFARRDILKGALGVAAIAAAVSPLALAAAGSARAETASRFRFDELEAGVDENHHVAPGYDADVLIRWGDPVLPGAPPFNPTAQTAAAQRQQFGYNNDFLAYFPMPGASNPSAHGLLVVNHEYTNEELMFAGLSRPESKDAPRTGSTLARTDIEMAAHGGSVIEVKRENGKWQVVAGLEICAPHRRQYADGHHRSGRRPSAHADAGRSRRPPRPRHVQQLRRRHDAMGHLAHLRGERPPLLHRQAAGRTSRRRAITGAMACPAASTSGAISTIASISARTPNEPNRFGWVVEIDPFDPASTPKKRTALGRAKHEGAAGIVSKDGRYVVYMGDDERFEYVYRFVTAGALRSRQSAGQPRHPRRRHGVGRALQRRRHARLAAAGSRPGSAHRRERLCEPGRCADREAPRRRPAQADPDGPPGGRRGQPGDRQGLCDAHQQRQSRRQSRSTPPIRAPTICSATSSR